MNDRLVRVAVVGVGDFGRNHARVYRQLEGVELVGVMDSDSERARRVADEFGTRVLPDLDDLSGRVDAASVAVPTSEHARIGCLLLARGIDVLVEKPIAASLSEADLLSDAARQYARILQVGHLERFNPALIAVLPIMKEPLYFEVHRLGVFSPRSGRNSISSRSRHARRSPWQPSCTRSWTQCAIARPRWWMRAPAAARWSWLTRLWRASWSTISASNWVPSHPLEQMDDSQKSGSARRAGRNRKSGCGAPAPSHDSAR